jgi:hypothetical protein
MPTRIGSEDVRGKGDELCLGVMYRHNSATHMIVYSLNTKLETKRRK